MVTQKYSINNLTYFHPTNHNAFITFPIIKAYSQFFEDITILQIDAHGDLYDELDGNPYSHACPFARIMEGSYAKRLVQVGVRTYNPHQRVQAEKFGVETIEMIDFDRVKQVVDKCLEKGLIGFWFLSTPTAFRLSPPLSITEDEIKIAGGIIINSIYRPTIFRPFNRNHDILTT